MEQHIRKYQPADLERILFIWESASRIAHPFLSENFLDSERDNIRNVYLPNTDTWVIERQKQVIGFLSLLENEIGGLFVQAEFHNMGAGTALMDKAKQLHRVLEVEVFEKNVVGRKFYAKCGFVFLSARLHIETGNHLMRLKFSPQGT